VFDTGGPPSFFYRSIGAVPEFAARYVPISIAVPGQPEPAWVYVQKTGAKLGRRISAHTPVTVEVTRSQGGTTIALTNPGTSPVRVSQVLRRRQ
jgi:hypothetical protein